MICINMVSVIPPGFVDLYSASMKLNTDINVMGVVTDFLSPVQSRGTDLMSTFSLADHTSGYGEGQKVKFFKPKASEHPDIHGTGDVVILRNVKVKEWSGMKSILSGLSSTWAVFHQKDIPQSMTSSQSALKYTKHNKAPEPKSAEMKYAIVLCNERDRDRTSYTEPAVSAQVTDSIVSNGTARLNTCFRDKASLIKDLVIDNKFFDLTGQVVKVYTDQSCTELYITDYTTHPLLYNYEWGCQGEDVPPRDGDEFRYVPARAKKQWRGPFGRRTLTVVLWPPHSYWAQTNIREDDFVFLRNVHIKYSKDSKMEGVLHSDRKYEDRIDVSKLSSRGDADDRVKEILRRKRDYAKQFKEQSRDFTEEARGQKRSGDDSEPLTKKQLKKKRKQEQEAAKQGQNKPENGDKPVDGSLKRISAIRAARNELNKNSVCPTHPFLKPLHQRLTILPSN